MREQLKKANEDQKRRMEVINANQGGNIIGALEEAGLDTKDFFHDIDNDEGEEGKEEEEPTIDEAKIKTILA